MSLAHMQVLTRSCVTAASTDELDFEREGHHVRLRGQGLGYPQVSVRVCERLRLRVRVCERLRVRVCERLRVRVYLRMCVCVCV